MPVKHSRATKTSITFSTSVLRTGNESKSLCEYSNISFSFQAAESLYQRGIISYPRTETDFFKEGSQILIISFDFSRRLRIAPVDH